MILSPLAVDVVGGRVPIRRQFSALAASHGEGSALLRREPAALLRLAAHRDR